MAQKIDAHHHLWRYHAAEYGWLGEGMQSLQLDFLPDHLVAELTNGEIDGTVAVQARQTLEETRWLLDLADQCDKILGVVGWAPIAGESLPRVLAQFEDWPKLKGPRHVIQAEPDDTYILRADFNDGIHAMLGSGLVYDILIYERHLPQAIDFVDKHPQQVFVLDHIAKPRIRDGTLHPWAESLHELAHRENVWCKVSGVVTEANWENWTLDTLRPYLDVVVHAFSAERLMVGSDWPVCLVATGYTRWFDLLRTYFTEFTQTERDAIFGGNAVSVYGLK